VRCDGSEEHSEILSVAWILVAVWPIGMVVLYAALLIPLRFMLLDEMSYSDSPLVRATAFLHRDYKTVYYWWEVVTLFQRTTLTGWLLLLDVELQFIRIMTALIISISFLIAVLACNPYKSTADYLVAAGIQILFVCIFLTGLVVRLYEDISNDLAGGAALAYRFIGLNSSEEVVVMMIMISFMMLVLLVMTVVGETYMLANQHRLEARFSVCTMDPPYIKWKQKALYACFLSHYKMEAASDARYIHDMLRKMLKAPVFLDSSTLSDLRNLITDGVHKSEALVLLATKNVLSRPWCLLELLETVRVGIPVVIIKIRNSGFTFDAAHDFVANLEAEMETVNPSGLALLHARLGSDLSELKRAVSLAIDANNNTAEEFDAHAGDATMLAMMKDLVEQLVEATGRPQLKWLGSEGAEAATKLKRRSSFSTLTKALAGELDASNIESAVFVCCSRVDALNHARVLRWELAVKLNRGCAVGGGSSTAKLVNESELFVVLLTQQLLLDANALFEVWMAMQQNLPIVTVMVSGAGYDYAEASAVYEDLPSQRPETAAELQQMLPDGVSVGTVGRMLHGNLTAIIALSWSPLASQNHLAALVDDITSRIKRRKNSSLSKVEMKRNRRFQEGAQRSNSAPPVQIPSDSVEATDDTAYVQAAAQDTVIGGDIDMRI